MKKKVKFFKRVKDAITNFDEYKNFLEEDLSIAIKYVLKLVLVFSLVIGIALSIKLIGQINNFRENFNEDVPDFKIEEDILIIHGENKEFIKSDLYNFYGIIINSEKENIDEELNNYQVAIALLKDKIVIKNSLNELETYTYKELSQNKDLSVLNKQSVYEFTNLKNMAKYYVLILLVLIILMFIVFLLQVIFDILLLSLIGFLLSRIIGLKLKYKSIFNLSVYSMTLSVILNIAYVCVNLFTGFQIKYFDIGYNLISYIYIATALLIIKADLIKQNIELSKIIKVQKQVRKEKEEQRKEEKENDKKEEKNKDKKKKEENDESPEGNEA